MEVIEYVTISYYWISEYPPVFVYNKFCVFKPGRCWPAAGVCLVSKNCFVRKRLYACLCVCPPPRLLITSGVMWWDIDPI